MLCIIECVCLVTGGLDAELAVCCSVGLVLTLRPCICVLTVMCVTKLLLTFSITLTFHLLRLYYEIGPPTYVGLCVIWQFLDLGIQIKSVLPVPVPLKYSWSDIGSSVDPWSLQIRKRIMLHT